MNDHRLWIGLCAAFVAIAVALIAFPAIHEVKNAAFEHSGIDLSATNTITELKGFIGYPYLEGKYNESFTFKATLKTATSSPIQGETLNFYLRKGSGNWTNIGSDTTDSAGYALVTRLLEYTPGNDWEFYATFNGTVAYNPSSSGPGGLHILPLSVSFSIRNDYVFAYGQTIAFDVNVTDEHGGIVAGDDVYCQFNWTSIDITNTTDAAGRVHYDFTYPLYYLEVFPGMQVLRFWYNPSPAYYYLELTELFVSNCINITKGAYDILVITPESVHNGQLAFVDGIVTVHGAGEPVASLPINLTYYYNNGTTFSFFRQRNTLSNGSFSDQHYWFPDRYRVRVEAVSTYFDYSYAEGWFTVEWGQFVFTIINITDTTLTTGQNLRVNFTVNMTTVTLSHEMLYDNVSITYEETVLGVGTINWIIPVSWSIGNHTITIRASPGYGYLGETRFNFTIIPNTAPRFTSEPTGVQFPVGQATGPLLWQAADDEGNWGTYTMRLSNGTLLQSGSWNNSTVIVLPENALNRLLPGTWTINMTVKDGRNAQATSIVGVNATNSAPFFTSTPSPVAFRIHHAVASISWTASDAETNWNTYTIAHQNGTVLLSGSWNATTSMTIDVAALNSLYYGIHPVTITIRDRGGLSTTSVVNLTAYPGSTDPVHIIGNSMLAIFPNKTGSGAVMDPYLLTLDITIFGANTCMHVEDTTTDLMIGKCHFSGTGAAGSVGIWLENCGNVKINESSTSMLETGIKIEDSRMVHVINCSIFNNTVGLLVIYGYAVDAGTSLIANNSESGMIYAFATYCTLGQNHLVGNGMHGIQIADCIDIEFGWNTVERNGGFGVQLHNATATRVRESTISLNALGGISVELSYSCEIDNNAFIRTVDTACIVQDTGSTGISMHDNTCNLASSALMDPGTIAILVFVAILGIVVTAVTAAAIKRRKTRY
nr:right-handed parallel beta-helix repeat-containing protein [Candidatus Sigynarchaeota archaeon]